MRWSGWGWAGTPHPTTSPHRERQPAVGDAGCASGSTYVYVDWNNDGTADLVDLNGDGDTTDTVDGINESTSNNGIPVTQLQSVRLFEPTHDRRLRPERRAGLEPHGLRRPARRRHPRLQPGAGLGPGPPRTPHRLRRAWTWAPRSRRCADRGHQEPDAQDRHRRRRPAQPGRHGHLQHHGQEHRDGCHSDQRLRLRHGAGQYDLRRQHHAEGRRQRVDQHRRRRQRDAFPLDVTGGVLLGDLDPGATFYVRFDVTLARDLGIYEEIPNCDTTYTAAPTMPELHHQPGGVARLGRPARQLRHVGRPRMARATPCPT